MGDSAGGGLTLLTIQALITHQLPVPRGLIAISPWDDMSTSGESYTRNEKVDTMLNVDSLRCLAAQLLDPSDSKPTLNNPLLTLVFGSFKGFPSMYVIVSTAEGQDRGN